MRSADRAWLTLAAGVLAYEVFAPRSELLSDGCDRYLEGHPWLTRAVVAMTALHLVNVLPVWCDAYGVIGMLRRSDAIPGPIDS